MGIIPKRLSNSITRMHGSIRMLRTKKEYFKNSFFPSSISLWGKLDINIRNAQSLVSLIFNLLKFIRPISNSIYNIHNTKLI